MSIENDKESEKTSVALLGMSQGFENCLCFQRSIQIQRFLFFLKFIKNIN